MQTSEQKQSKTQKQTNAEVKSNGSGKEEMEEIDFDNFGDVGQAATNHKQEEKEVKEKQVQPQKNQAKQSSESKQNVGESNEKTVQNKQDNLENEKIQSPKVQDQTKAETKNVNIEAEKSSIDLENKNQVKTSSQNPTSPDPNQPPAPSQTPQNPPPIIPQPSPQEPPSVSPSLILKQAQKQRIGKTMSLFSEYTYKSRIHIFNHKSVINNVCEEIDRRKAAKYVTYHLLKEYFNQHQTLAKGFHQNSYKVPKEQKQTLNKHIDMSTQLKQGFDLLALLRKQSGADFRRFQEYVGNRVSIELQSAFNKYISEMNRIQSQVFEKKKTFLQLEQNFKKKTQKLTKVFQKGKQGKQQDQDIFVEMCKFIFLEKQFRKSLVVWGKSLIELKRVVIAEENKLNQEVQNVLNSFKNASAGLYAFHQQKFQKIIQSKEQITKENRFCKLCNLQDIDYIKLALFNESKIQKNQFQDHVFEQFLEMDHFQSLVGKSQDLLKGMINKSFLLKNKDEELINTVSGNLVHFNTATSEYKEKFNVKNLSATIIGDGVVQFDEVIPGIIFKQNKTVRLEFRDEDRAQQLICLLNSN